MRTVIEKSGDKPIELETLRRIHAIKLEYCDSQRKSTFTGEHELLRKFVPKARVDIKALTRSVLDGSFDFKAEE